MAQWISLHLPSYSIRFKSQAEYYLIFLLPICLVEIYTMIVKITKVKQKSVKTFLRHIVSMQCLFIFFKIGQLPASFSLFFIPIQF